MFDSNEIARRALLRAEAIKARKKQLRRRVLAAGSLLSVCALVIASVGLMNPAGPGTQLVSIEDGQVPLAAPPEHDSESAGMRPEADASAGAAGTGGATGAAADEHGDQASAQAQAMPAFMVPAYDRVTKEAGMPNISMVLPNPGSNSVLLTFELILEETGETLFMSDFVTPSASIEGFALSRALEEGEHNAVLVVRAYEPTDSAAVGGARVEFTIAAN
jgi:hypothetical protein